MEDRVSIYPGRVTLTPVAGQANTYDMVRADSPTKEGTPLNKNNLLKDSTAALYGLGTDAVPDDVFQKLAVKKGSVEDLVIQKITTSCTWTAPKAVDQLFRVFAVGGGGGGYVEIKNLTIAEGTTVSVVCGAGGAIGAGISSKAGTAASGGRGGTTSFGSLLSAGGYGGGGASSSTQTAKSVLNGGAGGGGGTYGGGGFFNGGTLAKGGDGGVLIMYFKEA